MIDTTTDAAKRAADDLKVRYVHRFLGTPVRSVAAQTLIETFLVICVLTVLVIRFFLILTGYPQLGGNGLHIAHLLWGGALLGVALIVCVALITRASRWVAAVLGGIGFGLFIDEIGKFVTSDNDYFFHPTFALIYVALVLIWLGMRILVTRKKLTRGESLANALDLLKEASTRDLNEDEIHEALGLLDKSDPANPLVRRVRALLHEVEAIPTPPPLWTTRSIHHLRDWYWRQTQRQWFRLLLSAIFVLLTLGALGKVADLGLAIADAFNKSGNVTLQEVDDSVNGAHLGFSGWATLASSTVVAVIYSIGVYKLFRRSRLTAYRWFEWGLLVSIFVVQVFDFADRELAAFGTCLFNLILLVTIRAMINEEERRKIAVSAAPAGPPAAGEPAAGAAT